MTTRAIKGGRNLSTKGADINIKRGQIFAPPFMVSIDTILKGGPLVASHTA